MNFCRGKNNEEKEKRKTKKCEINSRKCQNVTFFEFFVVFNTKKGRGGNKTVSDIAWCMQFFEHH